MPWAGQARAELAATGVTAPQPAQAGLPPANPQERQFTRLAAHGQLPIRDRFRLPARRVASAEHPINVGAGQLARTEGADWRQ